MAQENDAYTAVTQREDGVNFFRPEVLFESLRNGEFSFDSGLAEIVDNSIEAEANEINIHIETEMKRFGDKQRSINVLSSVAVTDDGLGMTPEVLQKCLQLGATVHGVSSRPIGRFGVGLTMGGISFARRIEVYSRAEPDAPFYSTHLDLHDIEDGKMGGIPTPAPAQPPEKQAMLLEGSTGTIVVLSNCDRLQFDPIKNQGIRADEQIKGLRAFLGRTYRKFLSGGMRINLHDGTNIPVVFLHDPLYLMGPTMFDHGDHMDEKAEERFFRRITMQIPDSDMGETADITVRISLLPVEWRKDRGAGGSDFAKKRKIPDNEGISILRADREVLYEKIPYLIGVQGQATYMNIDRFWGCEISFPPTLDSLFRVRYIKRGVEPINSLRDKIRDEITRTILDLRDVIQRDFAIQEAKKIQENGLYSSAEEKMAKANSFLVANKTPRASDKDMERIAAGLNKSKGKDKKEILRAREELKKELKKKPYTIKAIETTQQILFVPEYMGERILIKLNVNHPFYLKVLKPLCGAVEDLEGDMAELSVRNQQVWDAILLMLMSYCKAEAFYPGQTDFLKDLRLLWGTTLSAVYNNLE